MTNFNNMSEAQLDAFMKQAREAKKARVAAEQSRVGTYLESAVSQILQEQGPVEPSASGWVGRRVNAKATVGETAYTVTLIITDTQASDEAKKALKEAEKAKA